MTHWDDDGDTIQWLHIILLGREEGGKGELDMMMRRDRKIYVSLLPKRKNFG